MKTFTLKLSSLALFAALTFAASPSVRADAPAPSATTQFGGVFFDLVYLKSASGPVDVTNSLYKSQGQTYATLNNVAVPIVPDVNSGNVYSPSGDVIGYVVHVAQP